jgi:hypothetical protein
MDDLQASALPFDQLEPAEQLAENTRLYLLHCHHVLTVPS